MVYLYCYVTCYLHMNLLSIYAYSFLFIHCSFEQADSGIRTGRKFDHTIQRTFILVNGLYNYLSMACIAIYLFCVNNFMIWPWLVEKMFDIDKSWWWLNLDHVWYHGSLIGYLVHNNSWKDEICLKTEYCCSNDMNLKNH